MLKKLKKIIKKQIRKYFFKFFPELYNFKEHAAENSFNLESKIDSVKKDIIYILDYLEKKDISVLQKRDMEIIDNIFQSKFGKTVNWNIPRTFNEKIQWLKIYDRRPIKTVMADKYKVREFIEAGGFSEYLNTLYGVYENTGRLISDWAKFPEKFVIKANHWSGGNIIIKNKNTFDLKKLSFLDGLLTKNFYYTGTGYGEWPYKDIRPCLVAEQYLEDYSGSLIDYKIHCFNGIPEYIQVIGDRDHVKHSAHEVFYDKNWNKTPFLRTYSPYEEEIPKPENLNEMLAFAEKMSSDFQYLRVDLYNVNGKIYFGEFTFYPASGFGNWNSEQTDLFFGSKITLK